METKDILLIVITAIVVIILMIFLIRSNRKDRETMNPDATDATGEVHSDQQRHRDKT